MSVQIDGLKSEHEKATFDTAHAERNSRLDRLTPEQHEAATSGHVVRMIDFFFALALVQGILLFRGTVAAPWHSNVPAVLALGLIFYTVIRSFVGWHAAIEERRYRLFTPAVRTTELWRVYIDVLIVVVYAYLLLAAKPLQDDVGHDLTRLLWGFPLLFALYACWGQFRRAAWGPDNFSLSTLGCFGVAFVGLALAYQLNPFGFHGSEATGNVIALVAAGALMATYRYLNWWQLDTEIARWHGLPKPKIPSVRALGEESVVS
jgi:hypothetical protein